MYNKYDLFGGPLYWNEVVTKAFESKKTVKCTLSHLPGVCSSEVIEFSPEIVDMHDNLQYFLDIEIKKGRSHILSLYHAIRSTIKAISLEITKDKISSTTFSSIINQHLGYFQRLPVFIDFDEIFGEINICHSSIFYDSEFSVYNEMLKLEMLLASAYDLLWRDAYNMSPEEMLRAKIEYFITSGKHAYYAPELLIYKKSRGIECDEDIAVTCTFVKDFIEENSHSNTNFDFASIASFIFCSEMRVGDKQLQKIADSFEFTPPVVIDEGYEVSLATFNIFRSDYALSLFGDKLRLYVKGLESYLMKHFNGIESDTEGLYELPNIPFQVVETTMMYVGALFVFAYFRLNGNRKNKCLDKTISYLLDKQERDGHWDGCEAVDISSKNLTSIAIHALSATKALGWKPSCKLAAKWLIENEGNSPVFEDNLIQNVMLLDSLSMANGEDNLTFSLEIKPKQKAQNKVKKADDNDESQFNDISSWDLASKCCFIFNNDNRLLFEFDGQEKDLSMGHKARAYKLLNMFLDNDYVTSSLIKSCICTEKTKPNHVIRDINKAINLKLRSKFPQIHKDMKTIAYSKKSQAYLSVIPVKSLDQYNRDYIKDNEEIVSDLNNYKNDDY